MAHFILIYLAFVFWYLFGLAFICRLTVCSQNRPEDRRMCLYWMAGLSVTVVVLSLTIGLTPIKSNAELFLAMAVVPPMFLYTVGGLAGFALVGLRAFVFWFFVLEEG